MRILGVDYGRARTGLALSDMLGVTCSPFDVVRERNEDRLILKIVTVAQDQAVGEIVVGLPRPLAGGMNRQMRDVLSFVARLEAMTTIPVRGWDERFTSKLAQQGRASKGTHDAVAACYMLQSYLDSQTGRLGGP